MCALGKTAEDNIVKSALLGREAEKLGVWLSINKIEKKICLLDSVYPNKQ